MTKILNLYAGIGGNRKLWRDVEVTAVEINPVIAEIYSGLFPDDAVIVGDAHQYLLEHLTEYDFIWSSPPCPTHSQLRRMGVQRGLFKPKYPDMRLYQEITLLQNFTRAKFVVENVRPYYEPLIQPTAKLGRHIFWSNFFISKNYSPTPRGVSNTDKFKPASVIYGFSLDNANLKSAEKIKILRNLVDPAIGEHILSCASFAKSPNVSQALLFGEDND